MSVLEEIIAHKATEVAQAKERCGFDEMKQKAEASAAPIGFLRALRAANHPAIIAEVKRASPSKGVIRADLDPIETAKSYAASGATCISVLTDEKYFQGTLSYLSDIRKVVTGTPLLRKDFMIDPYQIWESRLAGADAILLIVAALDDPTFATLYNEALSAKLDILVEVHDQEELRRVQEFVVENSVADLLLGINNRNLKNFETTLETTKNLKDVVDSHFTGRRDSIFLVSESGIRTSEDIRTLRAYGAEGYLIGESLVYSGDPGENLATLIEEST